MVFFFCREEDPLVTNESHIATVSVVAIHGDLLSARWVPTIWLFYLSEALIAAPDANRAQSIRASFTGFDITEHPVQIVLVCNMMKLGANLRRSVDFSADEVDQQYAAVLAFSDQDPPTVCVKMS